MKQNIKIFFIAYFISFISLNGMISPQHNKVFLSSYIQLLEPLINMIDLDHTIVCSLALNKQTEKWLREKALCRKGYLRGHISHQIIFEDSLVLWHKYGSACGRKTVNDSEVRPSEMILMAYYIQKNISYKSHVWKISEKNTLRDSNLFFNEDGNICCYGLEFPNSFGILYLGSNQHVVQYCLPQHGKAYQEMLGLEIAPNYCRPLSQFISFPILLNALIQTKKTKGGAFELCNINDVIIPNDYKTCNSCDEYKKFEDLPKKVQRAFEDRYKQQSPFNLLTSMIRVYT